MANPRYKWLIQGFALCGHEKELHKFTLFKSTHTFIAYDDCVEAYREYMKTNTAKFKTLCLPPKILACAPIVGDLEEFVHDALESMRGSMEEIFEERSFQDSIYNEPKIMWDLYKNVDCACAGHRVLHSQSHLVFTSLQDCIYNFAQSFQYLNTTETTSWVLFIHSSK